MTNAGQLNKSVSKKLKQLNNIFIIFGALLMPNYVLGRRLCTGLCMVDFALNLVNMGL